MRVVLDTNVFVSGIFFSGPPSWILHEWRDGRLTLVLSAEIFEEYRRVGRILARQFHGVDLEPFLALLGVHAHFVQAPELPSPVCPDPADDKFLACALAANVTVIVSGDRDLLRLSGWQGIQVLTPRRFVEDYMQKS